MLQRSIRIYIYIYVCDDQNARTGVLWTFVVRFAWEAQEIARAGAKYINIVVLFYISEHLLL